MLVQKDTEIKRLREKTIGGRKSEQPSRKNVDNSGIDSDDDALSVVYQSNSDNDSDSEEQLDVVEPKIRKPQ